MERVSTRKVTAASSKQCLQRRERGTERERERLDMCKSQTWRSWSKQEFTHSLLMFGASECNFFGMNCCPQGACSTKENSWFRAITALLFWLICGSGLSCPSPASFLHSVCCSLPLSLSVSLSHFGPHFGSGSLNSHPLLLGSRRD